MGFGLWYGMVIVVLLGVAHIISVRGARLQIEASAYIHIPSPPEGCDLLRSWHVLWMQTILPYVAAQTFLSKDDMLALGHNV